MKIRISHITKTHSIISTNVKVPTNKDIEKAVAKLLEEFSSSDFSAGINLGFTTGAKWMREQLLKDFLNDY